MDAVWNKEKGKKPDSAITVKAEEICSWITFVRIVVHSTYFRWGGEAHQQVCGIPMGTNCAPELANLYLFTYEIAYLIRQAEQWNRDSAIPRHILTILLAKRFIDDIFFPRLKRVNLEDMLYDNREAGGSDGIYPPSLAGPTGIIDNPLELTTASEGRTVHYLDYNVKLSDRGFISTKVYDKRDDNLVFAQNRSFPHRLSTLSYKCKAGVLFSQLYRYERRSTSMRAFLDRSELLFRKMVENNYTPANLHRQIRAFSAFSPSKGSWQVAFRKLTRRLQDVIPPRAG